MKSIDLFAGIGGMRIAAQAVGFKTVFSSEIDQSAVITYEANFGDKPSGDITKIASSKIPDFDLLLAGFPCQPFSFAGKSKGFDDIRGTLFFDVARIIKEKNPKFFLLENVKGILSNDEGRTFSKIMGVLDTLDYHVSWEVINSADHGLPQSRERWYCVGIRSDVLHSPFKFPLKSSIRPTLKSVLENGKKHENLEVNDAWKKRIDRHLKSGKERVQHKDFECQPGSTRSKYPIFSYLKPDNTMRFYLGDPRKSQIQEGYFTSRESIAPTIIAGRVPQLWDLKRKLSVRECARLQGFADDFVFPVSDAKAYHQLGNSVSIPVIQKLLKQMLLVSDLSAEKSKSKSRRAA